MSLEVIMRHLQQTFGKIPKAIEENLKYLSYNDDYEDFSCVPCDKILKKGSSQETTTENFEKHLNTDSHKQNTITDEELWRRITRTFKNEIPQIIQNNRFVLGIEGENYECSICKKTISVAATIQNTENNFSYHLLSFGHEEKLKSYKETLGELHDVYGGIPQFILNHCQFLVKMGRHYHCRICEKQLQVHPTDLDETEESFKKHLHSLNHMKKAKETKAFSVFPELKQIFNHLPNYMVRNIEYISINGSNFFCSLCHKNIKFNRHNVYETEQNFKLHISSLTHEERLNARRNTDSEVFSILLGLFETFPDHVLDNMRYISINENDYFCVICKDTIYEGNDIDVTKGNLIDHFESSYHESNVESHLERCSNVHEDLEDLIGGIPEFIQVNIPHIEFKGRNKFECVLCEKMMTENNFEFHINSNRHRDKLRTLEEVDDELKTDLTELFEVIPQFIMNNLTYLGYKNKSDDFYCFLCEKTITLVNGNKKEELTEVSFRNHLLSGGHMAKLKHKANLEMETLEKLNSIFDAVPTFILCNIDHIENQDRHFYCDLCDAKIMRGDAETTELKFREHFFGARHKTNLKEFESDYDEAFKKLDFSFWRIPEFLLRNIDFLNTYNEDLFCLLCQEYLLINKENLEDTKLSLRCHIDSEQHQYNLKSI